MFARFKFQARQFVLFLRAVLLTLLVMLTGCDEKVAWRGVGTDGQDGDRSPAPPSSQRNISDVNAR